MAERWKAIPGYEGLYEASTLGRIRSVRMACNSWNGRVLRQRAEKRAGYFYINLSKNNVVRTHSVHCLIFDTFKPGKRNGRSVQVNHKDLDKSNNRPRNLEAATPRQNIHHAIRHGHHINTRDERGRYASS